MTDVKNIKIAFFSNFLNPHQLAFCKEMQNLLGDSFIFVATQPFNQKAVTSGFEDINTKHTFVLPSYLNEENYNTAMDICVNSEVVIIGSAPEYFFRKRIKTDKLTFRYAERAFKPKYNQKFNPISILGMIKGNTIYNNKPLYMLCASAYTASDYRVVGAYKGKAFKWGYFPTGSEKTVESLKQIKILNSVPVIMWAGRFIDWKKPSLVIELARYLKIKQVDFKLNMFGDGPEKDKVKCFCEKLELSEQVAFFDGIPNAELINQMEKSNVFVATSDYNEGWGAVINEAMSAGCGIVASSAMGSVPFLIQDGVNGFCYPTENKQILFDKVEQLLINLQMCSNFGEKAKETINNVWNAKQAAINLVKLCEELLVDNITTEKIGPCEKII